MKLLFVLVLSSCAMIGVDEKLENKNNAEVKLAANTLVTSNSLESSFGGEPHEAREKLLMRELEEQKKLVAESEGKTTIFEERINSLELSVAEIKSTLIELNNNFKDNIEKIKVLEKAFKLGVIPEYTAGLELTDNHFNIPKKDVKVKEVKEQDDSLKSLDSSSYSLKLTEAQNSFNSGKYDRAIKLYEEIGDKFSSKLTSNNQYYWMGLSYFYLKKYDQSKGFLEKYIAKNPKGNWVSYSKYYLAKCFRSQGLELRSAMILNELIDQKDNNSELKEMAQFELKQIKQSM